MQRSVDLIPSTHSHCEYIAAHMRQSDRDEVMAASGFKPFGAVYYSYLKSESCLTGLDENGIPIGMWGIRRETWKWNNPWLLGTDRIDELWRPFLRTTKMMFPLICAKYPCQRNHVYLRNKKSIAWLKWLGFEIEPPEPYGVSGALFCKFQRGA